MPRIFFSSLGVLGCALALFSTSFLGNVAADLHRHRADYGELAVTITRELSHGWSPSAIEQYSVTDTDEELAPLVAANPNDLRLLGPLLHASDIRVEPRWWQVLARHRASPDVLAECLSTLLSRAVRVRFTGRFVGGLADVSADLKSGRGRIGLWRLRIENRAKPRLQRPPERRVIGHA